MFMSRISSESSIAISVRSPSPIPSEAASPPNELSISIRLTGLKRDLASDISTSSSLNSSNASLSSLPRSSKRSSSTSNDLIYERDRFRARLHTLNGSSSFHTDAACDELCEVCDEVGRKTTKLMSGKQDEDEDEEEVEVEEEQASLSSTLTMHSNISPLDPLSSFYASLRPVDSSSVQIKHITLSQVEQVFSWYFNRPLPPTDTMFPWLHGLHKDNFAQRLFFLYQQQQQQQRNHDNSNSYTHSLVTFSDIAKKPKDARFLMTINVDHHPPKGSRGRANSAADTDTSFAYLPVLKNSVSLSEILLPIDISRVEMAEMIRLLVLKLLPEDTSHEDMEQLVSQFVSDCTKVNHLPTFLYLDPDTGVSLRNFHIQVSKLATFLDFIIYQYRSGQSTKEQEEEDSMSLSIARVLWLAQRNEAYVNGLAETSPYNIFVVSEIMDIKELVESYNDLFTVKPSNTLPSAFHAASITAHRHTNHNISSSYPTSGDGSSNEFQFDPSVMTSLAIWDGDYQVKERIETITISAATKISKHVWIGNIWDCHLMMEALKHKKVDLESVDVNDGSLTAPEHRYCSPDNLVILQDLTKSADPSEVLSHLSKPRANWRLFVHCNDRANFPPLSTLSSLLFHFSISPRSNDTSSEEYHVVEFPPSGSVGLGNCKVENLMSIINLCKLLYLFSSSTLKLYGVPLSLIYCSDGFTELSLIVLCYIIYSENIRLDQAMLKLHLEFGRPFYIFSSDVHILRKLEPLLRKFSPLNPVNKSIVWGDLEVLSNEEINEFLLGDGVSRTRLGYISGQDDDDDDDEEEDEAEESEDNDDDRGEAEEENKEGAQDESDSDGSLVHNFIKSLQSKWVEDVEGSLPSRILPYLYLGSLKHANNLTLLGKLGIQHIISAGEQLDWINGYKFRQAYVIDVEKMDNGNIEIYRISPRCKKGSKKTKRSRSRGCSIATVMKVNNLQDDGIDELSSSLPTVLAYINERYEEEKNGGGKILVHCRVGVSRSATIVISEVMRRLNVSLARAYLYVRVRRLNIVIQPNLRFMYELFKWEERVKEDKKLVGDEQVKFREIDWFVMCREIMRLNFPYLNS